MLEKPAVISPEELKQLLDSGDSNVLVLDVTKSYSEDLQPQYANCHIPGARYFDIAHGCTATPLFPRILPDSDTFQEYARSQGVNNESYVILADGTPENSGFFIGGRAWWMFRYFGQKKVSVLDGGMMKWKEKGFPTTDVMPEETKGNFEVNVQSQLLVSYEDMQQNLQSKEYQSCDSRGPGLYNGTKDDPKTGHYPLAVNLPFKEIQNAETQQLHSKEKLNELFHSIGIDLEKPLVVNCNSGMSSCSLILAAHQLGKPDARLYLGGFKEWSGKSDPSQIAQSE